MARVLIVGCGCRGRELAGALRERGHAVRGTTRREENRAAIEAAGAEAVIADPDRLATVTQHLQGVSALCWLMGSAGGDSEGVAALNGPRLASMTEALVDTHVRGIVAEGVGTADPEALAEGARAVREVAEANAMPFEVLMADPSAPDWAARAADAVERVLLA